MNVLLLFNFVSGVLSHGGMLWPPPWQASKAVDIENINSEEVFTNPPQVDPKINWLEIKDIKSWLTDQAYLGGHGEEYEGVGKITNPECTLYDLCGWRMTPWASPGRAPSLGGGCGIFGGNPYGCPVGNDTREAGSLCGDDWTKGTWTGGSSQLEVNFPQALSTDWPVGSLQDVAWSTVGYHWGGYTYRLCKVPPEGKIGVTEECFARNVLKFATPFTMMRDVESPGKWEKVEQNDLTEGTYPRGSAWRHIVKIREEDVLGVGYLRKDTVMVPTNLPLGDYVLILRWDSADPQIWVSCAYVRLVKAP